MIALAFTAPVTALQWKVKEAARGQESREGGCPARYHEVAWSAWFLVPMALQVPGVRRPGALCLVVRDVATDGAFFVARS